MENLPASLNQQLPDIALHFSAYAKKVLENSQKLAGNATAAALSTVAPAIAQNATAAAAIATPTAAPVVSSLQVVQTTSELLQKLSASIFHTLQLQALSQKSNNNNSTTAPPGMDMDFPPNHIVIDSSMDELQKQLAYDKLMNDVWIGVVLTLILISMVFCICSCFLYHQFRTWKRSYHTTVLQAAGTTSNDLEAMKLQSDVEDPVPEYTLVSGLPSYEAALELLQKTPKSCLLVYPSVFNVFAMNEKDTAASTPKPTPTTTTSLANPITAAAAEQSQSISEVTTPLLAPVVGAHTPAAPLAPAATIMTDESVKRFVPSPSTRTLAPLPSYAEACDTPSSGKMTAGDGTTMTIIAMPPDTVAASPTATAAVATHGSADVKQ